MKGEGKKELPAGKGSEGLGYGFEKCRCGPIQLRMRVN
jgi:hypothetical protein